MVPPKYKFYIGKSANIYFVSGVRIDPDSGEAVTRYDCSSATDILVSRTGATIYFDDSIPTETIRIHTYDKSGKYLSMYAPLKKNAFTFDSAVYSFGITYYYVAGISIGRDTVYAITSCNPHYKELNKKYAKENGQEFFRVSLDGKINLFGKDFDSIYNSNIDGRHIFLIYKYNNQSDKWAQYYSGEFSKTDCKFDRAKKKCELKTSPIDSYNGVMNKYENTYDLIKLAPEITKINMHKRSLMQVYVLGANSISNFFGGTYWEDDVNEVIDNAEDLVNKYYFAYIKAGNEFYIKNAGLSEVNGVYAGTNGYWSNWNGYTCYLDLAEANPNNICIKRNSDNAVLYKSERTWTALDVNDIYIGREDIVMVNVNNSNDRFTIQSPFVYRIYRRLLCDVDSVTDSEGTKNTYDLPADDFVTNNRNYKKCIGLTGGLFYCTSRAVDEPTRYGLNDYGQYFTNQFIPSSAGLERPLPISRNSWANASLWYVYDSFYSIWENRFRKQYTLKDSWSIAAVIKVLLKQIDPTLKHEATAEYSRFLYDESTPFSFARFYVCLTQKTNILKGDYDQPAQKAEISLEELTKMLRDCFRCYWYIEDGKFKIEHVLFFINGGAYTTSANIQLDFTKLTDQFNKKLSSYFQSEIEYDKTDLAQRYEFSWMDDATELFGGVTLDVESNYVQKDKVEEINASQFSADIDYMLFNPSAFSNDGFALLCPIKNGDRYELPIINVELIDENKDVYTATVQNWYASWIYLTSRFYMHDMPASSIHSNALGNLYATVKKCMKQTIEFPAEEDLDELQLVKTDLGNGKIDEFSINMETRQAKVKLTYSPK